MTVAAWGCVVCVACGPPAPPGEPAGSPSGPSSAAEGPNVPPATASPDAGPTAPWFAEVAADVGLDFRHRSGRDGDYHMAEILGAGVALFDLEGDGDLDVYLVQSGPLPGVDAPAGARRDRLYRNLLREEGRLAFVDGTDASGLRADGYGMGVSVTDVDRDGHPDLYVANLGANQLWRNRGDGTFEDWTGRSGTGDPSWSIVGLFYDADGDGDLDLWVANYVDLPESATACRDMTGAPDYCGPASHPAAADRFYRGQADGTFRDASADLDLAGRAAPTLGAVVADLDDDGRLDLFLANDGTANQLWWGRAGGPVEEALLSGVALDGSGKAEGSMGVALDDVDGDGRPDLFLTHLETETNTLYRSGNDGLFVDATVESGLGAPSVLYTGFGTDWIDVDLDGSRELAVANGTIKRLPALARAGDAWPYHQPNRIYRRGPDGRFADASDVAGPAFALSEVSRGLVAGDLDEDGDEDLIVTQNDGPVRLLRNDRGDGAPWMRVRPVEGRALSIGARAALLGPDGTAGPWRWASAGGSYLSSGDPRLSFGLAGRDAPVEGILVVWPDGTRERFPPPPLRTTATLVRGEGTTPP